MNTFLLYKLTENTKKNIEIILRQLNVNKIFRIHHNL